MKNYLQAENKRNHANHKLFEEMLRRALGPCEVLVVHHITFHIDGQEPNEIPSADTLMFDHEFMEKVFGEHYVDIMASLAMERTETRDALLAHFLAMLEEAHA